MHIMYCLADGNVVVARCLYQEKYQDKDGQKGKCVSIHRRLCEHGNFVPCVAVHGMTKFYDS
jgi:hypothetical protein